MSAFGDWIGFLFVLCIAAAESGGGTPCWLSAAQGSAVKWLHGCRLGIVMIYCCFGLTLLLPFLAGTLVGPPFPVLPQKSIVHKSWVFELRAHACLQWMLLALRIANIFRNEP